MHTRIRKQKDRLCPPGSREDNFLFPERQGKDKLEVLGSNAEFKIRQEIGTISLVNMLDKSIYTLCIMQTSRIKTRPVGLIGW